MRLTVKYGNLWVAQMVMGSARVGYDDKQLVFQSWKNNLKRSDDITDCVCRLVGMASRTFASVSKSSGVESFEFEK